jgi:sec-independent protein translocase protein TatC
MGTETHLRQRRLRFIGRRRKKRSTEAAMSMMEHLGELRTRLVIAAGAFVALSVVAFLAYNPVLTFFRGPLCDLPARSLGPQGCDLIITKVTGAFTFRIKMSALVGVAAAAPVWLYQIYAFVIPALTPKEKRYTGPFIASLIALFAIGSTFAYLSMPAALRFLIQIGGPGVVPLLGAEEYLNFIGLMLLGFGVTFELPLVLVFLGLVGAVTVDQLRSQRRVALVVITVVAAVVTPSQDPLTMMLMAVPLYLLYELTILVLRLVNRRRTGAARG